MIIKNRKGASKKFQSSTENKLRPLISLIRVDQIFATLIKLKGDTSSSTN